MMKLTNKRFQKNLYFCIPHCKLRSNHYCSLFPSTRHLLIHEIYILRSHTARIVTPPSSIELLISIFPWSLVWSSNQLAAPETLPFEEPVHSITKSIRYVQRHKRIMEAEEDERQVSKTYHSTRPPLVTPTATKFSHRLKIVKYEDESGRLMEP